MVFSLSAIAAGQKNAPSTPKYTNHLIHEKSPYLLLHAHNPVDWYPWGEEAFAKARRENKPIFLSVGYYTCHWCHVMERESYSNHSDCRDCEPRISLRIKLTGRSVQTWTVSISVFWRQRRAALAGR
jgi:hypothetical protein